MVTGVAAERVVEPFSRAVTVTVRVCPSLIVPVPAVRVIPVGRASLSLMVNTAGVIANPARVPLIWMVSSPSAMLSSAMEVRVRDWAALFMLAGMIRSASAAGSAV